jgi:hypothetical protein
VFGCVEEDPVCGGGVVVQVDEVEIVCGTVKVFGDP